MAKTAEPPLDDNERVERVCAIAGVSLSREIALQALTHRAYRNDHKAEGGGNYERLEFLGDAVLDLVAATILLQRFPEADEGELTQRRAAYVSEPALAAAATKSGLADLVRLSRAQTSVGDDRLPSICADVVEAVIGASFLEGGLESATGVSLAILGEPGPTLVEVRQDEKTQLQERLQAVIGEVPSYEIKRAEGPDHAPVFHARVLVGVHELAAGTGSSKKIATQAAARLANDALRAVTDNALAQRLKSE